MPKQSEEVISRNKQKIHRFISKYPGCTAGEISKGTGINHVTAKKLAMSMKNIRYKTAPAKKYKGMKTFYAV